MKKKRKEPTTGKIQPGSRPDHRDKRTNMAMPNDRNVERAREFVIENKK